MCRKHAYLQATATIADVSIVYVWLSALLFAFVHSVLAVPRVKAWFDRHGVNAQRYRLGYSLFAIVTTAAWLAFLASLPDAALYRVEGAWRWFLHALQILGAIVVWQSLQAFDMGLFLGLKEVMFANDPFHEHGIYRYIRHPMYTGFMLIMFAMPVQTVNGMHTALAVALYFIVGARFEEKRMLAGNSGYADYRRRVGAFLPKNFRSR